MCIHVASICADGISNNIFVLHTSRSYELYSAKEDYDPRARALSLSLSAFFFSHLVLLNLSDRLVVAATPEPQPWKTLRGRCGKDASRAEGEERKHLDVIVFSYFFFY